MTECKKTKKLTSVVDFVTRMPHVKLCHDVEPESVQLSNEKGLLHLLQGITEVGVDVRYFMKPVDEFGVDVIQVGWRHSGQDWWDFQGVHGIKVIVSKSMEVIHVDFSFLGLHF